MKYKNEIDHILSLIENADKEGLNALALLAKPDEFWLELISVSPEARAWVARRKYLSLSVYLNLCKYAEERLLIGLAANKKAPPIPIDSYAIFEGNPSGFSLNWGSRLMIQSWFAQKAMPIRTSWRSQRPVWESRWVCSDEYPG